MADECLFAMPDCDSTLDYTMKEYMKLVDLVNKTVERLNKQGQFRICSVLGAVVYFQLLLQFQEASSTATRWSWRCGRTTW